MAPFEKWLPQPGPSDAAEQRINECESLAALLTLATFAEKLTGADLMWAIDSSAAAGTLRAGYSPNRFLCALAGEFWRVSQKWDIRIWLFLVPSAKNLADPISRCELQAFADWHIMPAAQLDPARWWHLQITGPRRAR